MRANLVQKLDINILFVTHRTCRTSLESRYNEFSKNCFNCRWKLLATLASIWHCLWRTLDYNSVPNSTTMISLLATVCLDWYCIMEASAWCLTSNKCTRCLLSNDVGTIIAPKAMRAFQEHSCHDCLHVSQKDGNRESWGSITNIEATVCNV